MERATAKSLPTDVALLNETPTSTPPTRTIRGSDNRFYWFPNLGELWAYRELVLLLSWRDIKIRYAQTFIGFGWTILQPLLSTGIFTILFGKLARISSDQVPYPLFTYVAFLPWLFFVNSIGRCSNSLVENGHILSRVYFPRLLLPVGSMLPSVMDFFIGLIPALGLLIYYDYPIPITALVAVPALLFITATLSLGGSLFLSALNVRVRDIGNLVPFLLQAAMWMTPIAYPASLVPERFRYLLYFNPMAGIVQAFRAVLLGRPLDVSMLAVSMGTAVVVLLVGLIFFCKVEHTLADHL